jgi:hypothetical protein
MCLLSAASFDATALASRPAFPSFLVLIQWPGLMKSEADHPITSVRNEGADSDLDKGRPAWLVKAACDLTKHCSRRSLPNIGGIRTQRLRIPNGTALVIQLIFYFQMKSERTSKSLRFQC